MRATIAMTLVASVLLSSCSMVIVTKRAREQQRPSRSDYAAPIVESVISAASIVAIVFVAQAEAAKGSECTTGFTGQTSCTLGFGGTAALSITALAATVSAIYGWVKIPAMRSTMPDD